MTDQQFKKNILHQLEGLVAEVQKLSDVVSDTTTVANKALDQANQVVYEANKALIQAQQVVYEANKVRVAAKAALDIAERAVDRSMFTQNSITDLEKRIAGVFDTVMYSGKSKNE